MKFDNKTIYYGFKDENGQPKLFGGTYVLARRGNEFDIVDHNGKTGKCFKNAVAVYKKYIKSGKWLAFKGNPFEDKTTKKAYKILANVDGELYSLNYVTTDMPKNDKYMLRYELGKRIEPKDKDSKIFVFANESSARRFVSIGIRMGGGTTELWEVKIPKNSRRMILRSKVFLFRDTSSNLIEQFWKNKKRHKKVTGPGLSDSAPVGTYGATWVQLVRKIN